MRFAVIALVVLSLTGCSVPNLDSPSCAAGREAVRQFYAFHIADDSGTSADELEKRRSLMTPRLAESTLEAASGTADPFSGGAGVPRAFRVGECVASSDDRATLKVLLFWRDGETSTQRAVDVDTVRDGEKWLLDRISN